MVVACSLVAPAVARAAPAVPTDFVVENAVTSGSFTSPTCLAFFPDGRMLVGEKSGRVWVVENGIKLSPNFIDLRNPVLDNLDRAFMSIAIDPNWSTNRYVYFLYTVDPDSNGTETNEDAYGRLVRYQTSAANPNVVDASTRAVLFGRTWPEGPCVGSITHTVGSLRWGTDGSLLVSVGEGAQPSGVDAGGRDAALFGAGKTNSAEDIGAFRSQYLQSLAGKILRLNPATGQGYSSNPFYDGNLGSVQSRVWAYGVRNPFRVTVRPGTGATDPASGDPGTLYVGDVGWETWEEMSVVNQGGRNLGWPCYEGTHSNGLYQAATPSHHGCGTIGTGVNPSPHTPPITDWHHTNPNQSSPSGITGNASAGAWFYTGTSYPATYQGALFYSDYAQNWIRVLKLDGNDNPVQYLPFGTTMDAPVDLTQHPVNGDLYYVSITTGQVRRIRYIGQVNSPPTAVAGAVPTTGPTPLTVDFSSAGSDDPDDDPLTYLWDFGDGSSSTAANPSHLYPNAGSFNVTLTVDDGNGGIDTDQVLILAGTVTGFPTTPVLDNFNRANGPVGPSWVDPQYGINRVAIVNNAMAETCCPSYAAPLWAPSSFGPSQEAYFTFSPITQGATEHSINVKMQYASYGSSHVEVRYDGSAIQVATFDDAGPGWVARGATIPVTFAAGDQFGVRAMADGSVEVFKNGVSIGVRSLGNWAYAASGGYIGLALDDASGSPLDNFGGGTYVPVVNTPPDAIISAPSAGSFFVEELPVELAGDADDGQQSASAMAYHWDVALHHNNHTHPGAFLSDLRNDSFVPEDHEDGTGTWMEVRLYVTDGGGLSDTASVEIYPEVDLEPSAVTVSPDPALRIDVANFSFALRNHGRMLSRRTLWRLVLDNTVLAEGDTMVPPLDSLTFSIPAVVAVDPGTHDLRLVVDTLGVAPELSETNNASIRALEVQDGPVAVGGVPRPEALSLSRPMPNPTSGRATLRLQLPRAARVRFAIHDIQGREVWSPSERELGAGRWALEWDSSRASAGVYLARVEVEGSVWLRRIAVVR